MADTQNTIFVFRPDQQNLAPKPLTPFSAVTPHRATASRARRLISTTTLEMIIEEDTAPEEDHPSTVAARDTLPVTQVCRGGEPSVCGLVVKEVQLYCPPPGFESRPQRI
ncbi:unnamed protein product [Brassica oleracea var. botrytis]